MIIGTRQVTHRERDIHYGIMYVHNKERPHGKLYHAFDLLRKKHDYEIIFDPSETEIDEAIFGKKDWRDTVYREWS